jgi:hypothetical protein
MIDEKSLIPNSIWTRKNLTEMAQFVAGQTFDPQKLRLKYFTGARLNGSGVTANPNEVFVIMSSFGFWNGIGWGTVMIDGSTIQPYQILKDVVCTQMMELTGTAMGYVQYAIFTWD